MSWQVHPITTCRGSRYNPLPDAGGAGTVHCYMQGEQVQPIIICRSRYSSLSYLGEQVQPVAKSRGQIEPIATCRRCRYSPLSRHVQPIITFRWSRYSPLSHALEQIQPIATYLLPCNTCMGQVPGSRYSPLHMQGAQV